MPEGRSSGSVQFREEIFLERARAGQFRVDAQGRIWRTVKGGERRAELRTRLGYLQVRLPHCKRRLYFGAHRCVWVWFYGSIDPSLEINHINGIKDDNRIENLELVTRGENLRHSYTAGLRAGDRSRPSVTQDLSRVVIPRQVDTAGLESDVRRHVGLMTPEERFFEKVRESPNGCLEWTAKPLGNGYGRLSVNTKSVLAHRFAYELRHGRLGPGLVIVHTCGNRLCVNADHLTAMTVREARRSNQSFAGRNARKTHCASGHEFNSENTALNNDGSRRCRICAKRRDREAKQKRRGLCGA